MILRAIYSCIFFLMLVFSFSAAHAANGDEATLKRAYQKEKNPTKRYYFQLELGRYYLRNDVEKADSIRSNLLASSRQEADSARFQALLFDLYVEQLHGNQSAYYTKIIELTPFLNRLKSTGSKITVYHLLAEYHISLREFPQAEVYLEEAGKMAKKTRNYEYIGENNKLYAQLEQEKNNKTRALNYVEQAIAYARRSPNKSLLAACVNTQAKIYGYFGQIELSVSKNWIALQLARETNDYPKVVDYELEMGESQVAIYNYREAQKFFAQALETAERIHDDHLVGLALANLGMVHLANKDYAQAIGELNKAINILEEFNDLDGLGKAHMLLGNVFREKERYNEALRYYNQALVYFESSANRAEIASVYHLVGTVFEKQKKYANALNYLKRSVEIRSQFGYKGAIYPSYRAIAEVYKKTGDIKQAFHYLELYSNYMDSSKVIEVSTKIAEITELYRAEDRERVIANQRDSIELQNKQKENAELRSIFQTYIIIGFLLLLVFGAIILYSRWKQREIKQQQKEAEMNQVLLRSQMNPHFVFNAMSVIQSYIYENDTKNSTKFLVNFSKLMRLILENSSKEFIPLSTEIDILNKYLETQKLRFVDRFEYQVNVADNLLELGVVIPPMITQPFIENALEHGQLHTIDGGFIHVDISKDNELLRIVIMDNGVGRKGSEQNKKSKAHKSMAMKITQDRIDNLSYKYRIQGRMEIDDYNKDLQTGTIVNIYLPFKTEQVLTTENQSLTT